MTDYAPEDYGKSYRIAVNIDDVDPGTLVELMLIGQFLNGDTYDVPQDKVTQFERGSKLPFTELVVPSSCQIIPVEE
jgi:hypothetical protein